LQEVRDLIIITMDRAELAPGKEGKTNEFCKAQGSIENDRIKGNIQTSRG
jgi:hypothetical protein